MAEADPALAVADHDQRREAEALAALHRLRHAIDVDELLDQLLALVLGAATVFAAAAAVTATTPAIATATAALATATARATTTILGLLLRRGLGGDRLILRVVVVSHD
ncbi:hypothetical protein GCM10011380_02800 [Sphingomonas metalli]|uniref:Uncharacterized protein n=1 Tax=Sphingomonas metalli TaxID=1779358 RepID=A0A916WP73_9SPHN|nr:hypothetical protein GCM10011380_02800 [Sphingomonas metalli]